MHLRYLLIYGISRSFLLHFPFAWYTLDSLEMGFALTDQQFLAGRARMAWVIATWRAVRALGRGVAGRPRTVLGSRTWGLHSFSSSAFFNRDIVGGGGRPDGEGWEPNHVIFIICIAISCCHVISVAVNKSRVSRRWCLRC